MKDAAKRVFTCKYRCRYSRKRAKFCRILTKNSNYTAEIDHLSIPGIEIDDGVGRRPEGPVQAGKEGSRDGSDGVHLPERPERDHLRFF